MRLTLRSTLRMVVGAVRLCRHRKTCTCGRDHSRGQADESDAALVDSWVKQSPEYTAREDAPGAARRSGTSANKRSAELRAGREGA